MPVSSKHNWLSGLEPYRLAPLLKYLIGVFS